MRDVTETVFDHDHIVDSETPELHVMAYYQELVDLKNDQIVMLQEKLLKLQSQNDALKDALHRLPSSEKKSTANHKPLKILVLGASKLKTDRIYDIAQKAGLSKESLRLEIDWSKIKKFDLNKLKYGSYDGILVGPIPHKAAGVGNHASAVEKLREEEGFPPSVAVINSSGELEISGKALSRAFRNLLTSIYERRLNAA